MKIFQDKNIEDKAEIEDLIMRLVEVTKINCMDCSLTDDELAKLKQISDNLGIMKENTGKDRLEEIIEFQLAAPNKAIYDSVDKVPGKQISIQYTSN